MRTFLRTDWRPWTFLAFVLIFGLFWFALSVNSKAITKHVAVEQCLHNRPLVRNFSTHVEGVNKLADVLLQNSVAVLRATHQGDPQMRVRRANLRRIERARREVRALRSIAVPTKAQCNKAGG